MLALEGIKILDLSRMAPMPYCTMILADLGADVLKIEDPSPITGRRAEQAGGTQAAPRAMEARSPYAAMNRNKRSMGLNLKHKEAQQVFYKLTETADVVTEDFRPGVSKRLGIDYEVLSKINPRIIYCPITGYGQDGPYRDLVGHDINYISTAGALGLIGTRGGPPVIPLNIVADFAGGGLNGVIGILAALLAREQIGEGQFVDISMMDGVMSLITSVLSGYLQTGQVPERGTSSLSGAIPHYNTYETKDGKLLSLGSLEPWFYANLCRTVGREDFIPYANDQSKHEEVFSHFREVFRTKTRDEWLELLRQTDTCCAPVYTLDELASDPQIQHRQMIVEVEHPEMGKVKQPGIAVKLSKTPGAIRSFPPKFFEHTDQVMKGLGYSEEDIARLRSEGAIG